VRRLPDGRVDLEGEHPPVAMSFGTTAWNRTGLWRSRTPIFADRTAPCAAACPAGEDVPDQLRLAAQGRLAEAGALALAVNPFPATTGRVCPHPCTAGCHRAALDGALDVPGVERALGDALLAAGARLPRAPRAGIRAAVVGAGPAGLTAASRLAQAGADVRLFAREATPGGLLRTGIPPYRLPRAVLDAEVARALEGVAFEGGRSLGEGLALAALLAEHDAVVVALGRHAARRLAVPGADAPGVVDGLALLDAIHRGEPAPPCASAVVIGGGNTALDCARTLVRLGRSVTICYRRGEEDMPAFPEEIAEALEEGVKLDPWSLPAEVILRGGRARWLRLERARPGPADASGRPRPVPVPGSEYVLPADLVVVAAGETLDAAGLPAQALAGGDVAGEEDGRTPVARLFAAGDCLAGGGTVSHAIGSGRRAADALLAALGVRPAPPGLLAGRGARADVVPRERVKRHRFPPAPPLARGRRDVPARLAGALEVRLGFDAARARAEASRCLSCGSCTGCDVCVSVCPDRAVVAGAPGAYAADPWRCKGCGLCAEECPRGVVDLAVTGPVAEASRG
jgi:NADPH-dependent glutamate synthase beta subunit-like oxidoreductase